MRNSNISNPNLGPTKLFAHFNIQLLYSSSSFNNIYKKKHFKCQWESILQYPNFGFRISDSRVIFQVSTSPNEKHISTYTGGNMINVKMLIFYLYKYKTFVSKKVTRVIYYFKVYENNQLFSYLLLFMYI